MLNKLILRKIQQDKVNVKKSRKNLSVRILCVLEIESSVRYRPSKNNLIVQERIIGFGQSFAII